MPMKCPVCHALAYVSKVEHLPDCIERRRYCKRCGLRFTTREVYADGRATGAQAPRSARAASPDLSPRECQVLALLAEGKTNREIGLALGVSPHTVKQHLGHIYAKLDVTGRLEAALWAVRHDEGI